MCVDETNKWNNDLHSREVIDNFIDNNDGNDDADYYYCNNYNDRNDNVIIDFKDTIIMLLNMLTIKILIKHKYMDDNYNFLYIIDDHY